MAYRSTPYYLVASRDLGLRGSNHRPGWRFLTTSGGQVGDTPRQYSVCARKSRHPDRLNSPFQEYSQAVYRATGDSRLTRVERVSVHKSGEIELLLINSAYHLDPGFGMVDCGAVRSAISSLSPDSTRIAVVHHHQIPIELLTIHSSNGFAAVLHGYQHVSLSMTIGPIKLIGVGTLNFTPGRNFAKRYPIEPHHSCHRRFFSNARRWDSRR